MTSIIAVHGTKSIWMCADRRLTYPKEVRDDGMKVIQIHGTDGEAFLGYAGLGAIGATQPSAWMNDLLIGRTGTIEQKLALLAEATTRELAPKIKKLPKGQQGHFLIASALLDGRPTLYTLLLEMRDGEPKFRFDRHGKEVADGAPWPTAVAGSGAAWLLAAKHRGRIRDLLRMLKKVEAGKISSVAFADRLAAINNDIAQNDDFVSRQSVVVWSGGGVWYEFYDGLKRGGPGGTIPQILSDGTPIGEIAAAMMPEFEKMFAAHEAGVANEQKMQTLIDGVMRRRRKF